MQGREAPNVPILLPSRFQPTTVGSYIFALIPGTEEALKRIAPEIEGRVDGIKYDGVNVVRLQAIDNKTNRIYSYWTETAADAIDQLRDAVAQDRS